MDNPHFDSESYWSGSTHKAFSFDDDDDTDCTDCERGAGSSVSLSVDCLNVGASNKWDTILNDDAISEASFASTTPAAALNLSIKNVISDEALSVLLQEQTLDDRLIAKGISPEEELKLLRRQLQTTLFNPSAQVTAYKLSQGKLVPLEVFRSLHEKQELLDAVLQRGAGDAVIGVLLFLKRTLNNENFNAVLRQRPKALQHYVSYLRSSASGQLEAIEILKSFGQAHEAAALEFRCALKCENLAERKRKVQNLLEEFKRRNKGSNANAALSKCYQQTFENALSLLELVEKERGALDNLIDLNSTPIEVLHACCRKHGNWKEQDLMRDTSPFCVADKLQISSAQFEWTALNERAKAQAYADLESVFERSISWNLMKPKQFHISFSLDVAITRLFALKTPQPVLYLFLSKVSNASEKLELAERVKCTKAVIDALTMLKETNKLIELRESLPERSEEQFYCEKAIKGLQSKRWSTDSIKMKLSNKSLE